MIFERIDAKCIRSTALKTFGAGGPSRTDVYCWRRLCTSFGNSSEELCQALSLVAKCLCSSYVHPDGIRPLLACCLIALDKKPAVRPIGVSEILCRIIAKAILSVLRYDVMEAAGPLQLCAGQIAGIEAAIHAVRSTFECEGTQGVLLVDASNMFNALNRSTALLNIRNICPSIFTVLCNCYHATSDLFVDGLTIQSQEGTTQGDPLAMPMYALATVPLIQKLSSSSQVIQTWYADDTSAAGQLRNIGIWWEHINKMGPKLGYFPNGAKSWLVVKNDCLLEASELFKDTNIQITSKGRPLLGSPIGSSDYVKQYVQTKVKKWCESLGCLSDIARIHPQSVYSAFVRGVAGWWISLCQTIPDICHLLMPLEDIIKTKLIPALTGRDSPNKIA